MSVGFYKSFIIRFFITAAILFFLTVPGISQLVELSMGFSRDTIKIGERTELALTIRKDPKVVLQSFSFTDSLKQEIEVLDSVRSSGGDSLFTRLTVTSFSPGTYRIPQFPIAFSHDNIIDTILSPELMLTVLSPIVDSQSEIRDIKPPLTLPFRIREIIPETGLALGGLLLLVLLVLFIVRRMRKKILLENEEKALPPHVVAFRELDRLKEEKLWQNGKNKEYYSRLSDITRVYLERRFGFPAMEYVTSETLPAFRKCMPQEEMLAEMLEGILLTADLVKFAKAEPLPAENQGNMDNAYLLVGQTKIEEVTSVNEKLDQIEKE